MDAEASSRLLRYHVRIRGSPGANWRARGARRGASRAPLQRLRSWTDGRALWKSKYREGDTTPLPRKVRRRRSARRTHTHKKHKVHACACECPGTAQLTGAQPVPPGRHLRTPPCAYAPPPDPPGRRLPAGERRHRRRAQSPSRHPAACTRHPLLGREEATLPGVAPGRPPRSSVSGPRHVSARPDGGGSNRWDKVAGREWQEPREER